MAELLVIADDLTGALDSGVQLASKGDRVLVSLDCGGGLTHAADADVLVIDSESRHDTQEVAYEKVMRLVREGRAQGVRHIYKKTDSGLRGNVGAELSAALEASGATHLNFVPAYPKQQRTTEQGIHYVAGTPLAKSIFAVDPVNPVTCSKVSDLIGLQSAVPVMAWVPGCKPAGIVVYDCATDEDMRSIASMLKATDPDAPMAGCAGLLEMLPRYSTGKRAVCGCVLASARLVVVSGSVNAVTSSQLDEAERMGAYRAHLPIREILASGWSESDACAFVDEVLAEAGTCPTVLIDTLGVQLSQKEIADGKTARIISDAAGLCAAVISRRADLTTMVVGGDALVGFVHDVGASLLEPVDELFPGIVVARYEGTSGSGTIITKSGAFGTVSLFSEIQQLLEEKVGGQESCR
ncbi:MAG: hypothetical protein IJI12_01740 [Atopobiaceae bacterium]|nr:hypothetical protein [Atopobiaceae bacterium]